ncbi:FUSC family membrane protein [Escherichia coli]
MLFPWPWLFAIGLRSLPAASFARRSGSTLSTIAFGALLIAIYTMLGTSLYEHWYQQPCICWPVPSGQRRHLLVISAFSVCPLQDNLARCYEQLARYLELKSRMFDLILKIKARHRCTIWLSPTVC